MASQHLLGFSVVVCTRNRSGLLADAVTSLRALAYPPDAYEIIVVDNASTDDTREVVQRLNTMPGHPIRYVYEPCLGLSRARNTGAHRAKREVVAYIDDDVLVTPGWLGGLADGYRFGGRNAGVVGGATRLRWEQGERPAWLPSELEGYLGETDDKLGDRMRVLDPGQHVVGCNFSVLRSCFEAVGGFSMEFGNRDVVFYSDEQEFFRRVRRWGKQLVYAPTARVYHRIPAERATRRYLLRRGYEQGRSDVVMSWLTEASSRSRLLLSAAVDALFLARDLLKAGAKRLAVGKPAAFAQLVYSGSRLGRIQQALWLSLHRQR